MSYDVKVGDLEFNHTYNLAPMFGDFMPGGVNAFHGKTGKEVDLIIQKGMKKAHTAFLRDVRDFEKKYNPSNGWGDVNSGMTFLINVLKACQMYPEEIVEVS